MTISACPETASTESVGGGVNRASVATLAAACLAIAAIAMTITTASVALAGVQAELRLGITELQWVLNSFIVSYAVLLLPFGAWGDRIGQRRLFLWGTVVFVIGAGIAVVANDVSLLVAGRALQGVGAALLTATGPAALTTAFADEAGRKRAFGYLGSSGGIGLALGALLAGAASSWGGWRVAYALPIPIALAALLVCAVAREALAARTRTAQANATWRTLLSNRQFVLSCVICLLFTIVWVALFIYAPLRMQAIDGLKPDAVGMTMLALLLPALVMPIAATRLLLVLRARAVLLAGFFVMALGLWLMEGAWSGSTSRVHEVVGLTLCGTGAGMLYGLVDYLGLTAVPAEQAGLASGAFNVVRLIGDILAAVIPGAVVLHIVASAFDANVPGEMLNAIAAGDLQVVDHLGLTAQARAAFASGMEWAIWALLGLTGLGATAALCVPLRR
jgi:MFS family permease